MPCYLMSFSDDLLNTTTLASIDSSLNRFHTNTDTCKKSCLILGCGYHRTRCLGYGTCLDRCKCDDLCVIYGDCCFDYWHLCTSSHNLEISAEMPVLREWSKYAIESVQISNNSISSMLKYYIHLYNNGNDDISIAMTRWKYTSCRKLSNSYVHYKRYYSVIDKCPMTSSEKELKEKCENADVLGFAPVYNKYIGIFQNEYCAMCHGLDAFNYSPMSLNFFCTPPAKKEISVLLDSGKFKDANEKLYYECSLIVDLIKEMLFQTKSVDYAWLLRQSCASQKCKGCELFCSSFKTYGSLANTMNSLSESCNIVGSDTPCMTDRRPDNLPPRLPDYSLLFSITRNTGLKVKKLRLDNLTYDTVCEKRAYLDLVSDICTDLTGAFFIPKAGKVYLPKHDSKFDVFKLIAINFTTRPVQHKEPSGKFTFTPDQGTECHKIIKNHVIHEHLSKMFQKHNETEKLICVTLNHTYDFIIDAFHANKNNFHGNEGFLIYSTDIMFDYHYCNTGDDLSLVKASIVNISGDVMVTVEVYGNKLLILANETIVIGTMKDQDNEFILSALVCARNKSSTNYLGIITVICNSLSMTFLFIVVTISLMIKSIRSKMIISIPQLSAALFLAQLLFQVCKIFNFINRFLSNVKPKQTTLCDFDLHSATRVNHDNSYGYICFLAK